MKSLPPLHLLLICLVAAMLMAVGTAMLLNAVCPKAPPVVRVDDERILTQGQGVIRHQSRGHGSEAVVLLHGFNGQLGDWNAVWDRLDGCGHTVRLDLPGFGGSVWNTDDYTLPQQAQRFAAFLDALGIDRVTLVGTSMGGSLAAWFAAAHPQRVNGVLLLAPSGYPDSLHYRRLFGLLVKPGPANQVAGWIARNRLYAKLFPESRALQATSVTASYGHPWARALQDVSAPTLLIWSRGDTSFHAAESVAARIKNSRLQPVAANAGHLLPSTRPALVAAAACHMARGVTPAQAQVELRQILAATGDE